MTEPTFKPNAQTKAILARMHAEDGTLAQMLEEFFALWEAEGKDGARRAGSIMAHIYVRQAARIAVFGAVCAGGDEPNLDLWLALCKEHGEKALIDVREAFADATPKA